MLFFILLLLKIKDKFNKLIVFAKNAFKSKTEKLILSDKIVKKKMGIPTVPIEVA